MNFALAYRLSEKQKDFCNTLFKFYFGKSNLIHNEIWKLIAWSSSQLHKFDWIICVLVHSWIKPQNVTIVSLIKVLSTSLKQRYAKNKVWVTKKASSLPYPTLSLLSKLS